MGLLGCMYGIHIDSEKMKHTSDYWMHVSLILQQFDGLVAVRTACM
jgi:hypothetical protein